MYLKIGFRLLSLRQWLPTLSRLSCYIKSICRKIVVVITSIIDKSLFFVPTLMKVASMFSWVCIKVSILTLVGTVYLHEIKIPQFGFTTLLQPMHMYLHVSCKYIKWMNEITSQVLWCFIQTLQYLFNR